MKNFADRVIDAVQKYGNPSIVGLDPRIEEMPEFIRRGSSAARGLDVATDIIIEFNSLIISVVRSLVPAVKLQIAFYEQYGVPGLIAFDRTVRLAKDAGLLVIVDAKRGDIASTAEAYAAAFLGRSRLDGAVLPVFDVDCITVSPFLGGDSLEPFLTACRDYGKGIFVLVKTSNPGSKEIQDRVLDSGERIWESLASTVDRMGSQFIGRSGYSSVGAVVGATFPDEARKLRGLMPCAITLVPGYGAQGGTAAGAAASFNDDGFGAVVNASRSVIYPHSDDGVSRSEFVGLVEQRVIDMREDLLSAVKSTTTGGE